MRGTRTVRAGRLRWRPWTSLNTRFGKDRVRFACSGLAKARDWWTNADFLSPRRTTRRDELLQVPS